jgi:DNA adenine methylase
LPTEGLLFDVASDATPRDARGSERWEPPLPGSETSSGVAAPFPWYGGKAYYADWLIERFPRHRVYVEPFGGAANVLLRKSASPVEVFNDLDARVVGFFRVLRDRATFDEFVRRLQLTPYARAAFEEALAEPEDADADPIDAARRFFVRCRQSIGGLGMSKLYPSHWTLSLRTRRAMAEPVSKYLSAIEGLEEVATRFRSVAIERMPAIDLIAKYDAKRPDDEVFFYCDPPYLPATRHGGSASTYGVEMTLEDHKRLLETLRCCVAKVMVSGYPHELYDDLLRGWRREELSTIAHLNNSSAQRVEVAWMNY